MLPVSRYFDFVAHCGTYLASLLLDHQVLHSQCPGPYDHAAVQAGISRVCGIAAVVATFDVYGLVLVGDEVLAKLFPPRPGWYCRSRWDHQAQVEKEALQSPPRTAISQITLGYP